MHKISIQPRARCDQSDLLFRKQKSLSGKGTQFQENEVCLCLQRIWLMRTKYYIYLRGIVISPLKKLLMKAPYQFFVGYRGVLIGKWLVSC